MTPKGVWVIQDVLHSPRGAKPGGGGDSCSQRHSPQGCRLGLGHRGGAHLHLGRAVRPLRAVTNRMSLLPARPQPQPSPPPPSPPPTPPPGPRALAGLAVRLSVLRGREPSQPRGRSSGVGGGGRSRRGLRSWRAQDAWRGLREPSSVPRAGREPPPRPLPLGPGSRPGALRSGAGARAGAGGQLPRMLLRAPRREGGPSGAGGDSARFGTGTGPGPAAACAAARSGSHAGSRSGSALCRGVGREREERAASQGGRRDRRREGGSQRASARAGRGRRRRGRKTWVGVLLSENRATIEEHPSSCPAPKGQREWQRGADEERSRAGALVLPPCTTQCPSGSQAPTSLKPARPAVFLGSVHPFACDCH